MMVNGAMCFLFSKKKIEKKKLNEVFYKVKSNQLLYCFSF